MHTVGPLMAAEENGNRLEQYSNSKNEVGKKNTNALSIESISDKSIKMSSSSRSARALCMQAIGGVRYVCKRNRSVPKE